ncbi:hypothetical protein L9G15_26410, partial [Shewanella sp. A3A]|nr:hypothetical protein [Shewanella ferrihydritica]
HASSGEKERLGKFVGCCFQEEQVAQDIQKEVSTVPWKQKQQPILDYWLEDSVVMLAHFGGS